MSCTPGVDPLGILSVPVKAAVSPAPACAVLPPLMRTCDSSTATASGSWVPPPGGIGTSEVESEGWLMVVGCNAGLMSAMGAWELPPDTEDSVPMSVSSRPCAPAVAMPYIGLCGLFWVSFCDMAHSTAPLVPVAVAGVVALLRMPRLMAPSACHRSPRDRKSTRLNSSHGYISYAVFCLKKKKKQKIETLLYYESHETIIKKIKLQ